MAMLPKARTLVLVRKVAGGVSGGKFASPPAPGSHAGLSTTLDFLGSHGYLIKFSTITPENGCCSLNTAEEGYSEACQGHVREVPDHVLL